MSEQFTANPLPSNPVSGSEVDAKGWIETILGRDYMKESHQKDATAPVERDAYHYNMDHKYRGKAIIFNHKHFSVPGFNTRDGTDLDRDSLASSLMKLDFEVELYNDLKSRQVLDVLSQVSLEDHSDRDCVVVAVFSHGVADKIYASDDSYSPEALWDPFIASKCPTLAGKPKLFFIQACQGEKLDQGTRLHRDGAEDAFTVVDGSSSKLSGAYTIPNRADFLMVYSTFPGYYSWRNSNQGSWFVQVLSKALDEFGLHKNILFIMTLVTRLVSLDYESNCPQNPELHQMKQVPFTTSTLMRELQFTRKNPNKCTGCVKTLSAPFTSLPRMSMFKSLRSPTEKRVSSPDGFLLLDSPVDEEVETKIGTLDTKPEVGKMSRLTLVKPVVEKSSSSGDFKKQTEV